MRPLKPAYPCSAFFEENVAPLRAAANLVTLQDQCILHLPIYWCGNNRGVSTAVCAHNPKDSAEPTLTPHFKALRELLDNHTIVAFVWIDNRDMIAYPLTKGKATWNELTDVLNQAQWIIMRPTESGPKQ